MKKVVILQPMFFPWVGYFEQIKLADVFVFYDDVQMPRGRSLVKRIKVKTARGSQWMTAPTEKHGDVAINQVQLDQSQNWRGHHRELLRHAYSRAPHVEEMLALFDRCTASKSGSLNELNCHTARVISAYFELGTRFEMASDLGSTGRSSERLLCLLEKLEATQYITGHGARNYLDHEAFEQRGIEVAYMDYRRVPYEQLHGDFDPHVSILDLIANLGREGREVIQSQVRSWRDFLDEGVET